MPDTPFFVLFPLVLIAMFALFWTVVLGLLSRVSGWSLLAESFMAAQPVTGEQFRFASAFIKRFRVFPVSYKGCLFLTISTGGIHLSMLKLVSFSSPPLYIPWSSIESVTEQPHLFGAYGVITIRNCPVRIMFFGPAGRRVIAAFKKYSSASGWH